MRDIKAEIEDKYRECCAKQYASVGTAMTAVKQLQILYNDYMLDALSQMHLTTETEKKVLIVLGQYTFPLEPTIIPKIEPSRIIQETIGNFTNIRIDNYPKISFSLIPGKNPKEVFPLLDSFIENAVAMCRTKYLKTGSSLLKIINSIVQRIDYTEPVNPAQAVINNTMEGLLKNNFDVEVIKDARIGDEYGSYEYFDLHPNKNISEQFITSPAVISKANGHTEILIRGSLVYPQIN